MTRKEKFNHFKHEKLFYHSVEADANEKRGLFKNKFQKIIQRILSLDVRIRHSEFWAGDFNIKPQVRHELLSAAPY